MTALGAILGVVLFIWGATRLSAEIGARTAPRPSAWGEDDLSLLRERFATSDMSVSDFQEQVERIIENGDRDPLPDSHGRPNTAVLDGGSTMQSWEIHIHDAPPGHHLHLHLP